MHAIGSEEINFWTTNEIKELWDPPYNDFWLCHNCVQTDMQFFGFFSILTLVPWRLLWEHDFGTGNFMKNRTCFCYCQSVSE
jgi:hypothetical protein